MGSKAEMALELLYRIEPNQLEPPGYIEDGLKWLEKNLEAKAVDRTLIEREEMNGV